MNQPIREPWYRRPLPVFIPGWLIVCLAISGALGYVGYHATVDHNRPGSGIRGTLIGAAIGFPAGIFLLTVVQAKSRRAHAGTFSEGMIPPHWASCLVSVVVLSLLGYDFVARQEIPGRRGRVLAEGSPAVCIGLATIVASALIGIRVISQATRKRTVVLGAICLMVSTIAFLSAIIKAVTGAG